MKDSLTILERRLRKGLRRFTMNEAAAVTGLPMDDTRDALDVLIRKYECRLQVTENGDLICDFGKALHRRGRKTAREYLEQLADWLWKAFKLIFKAWITVMLVVYFLVFVALLLVWLFSQGSSRRDSRGSNIDLSGVFYIFMTIFRWQTHTGTVIYRTDSRGYSYREFQPHASALGGEDRKSFIAAVYDFVLGPERVEPDALSNYREVAAFLNEKNGIFVTAELEALAGWTFPQAEAFFTDCLSRFQGDVKVSEKGVVYGQFEEITRSIGETGGAKITYYWDEYEPEYQLNGNSFTHNFWITVMNGFNLVFSYLVLSGSLYLFSGGENAGPPGAYVSVPGGSQLYHLLLGWIPFIFSLLFFLVPLLRWLRIQYRRKKRLVNNIRKRFYKAIFRHQGAVLSLEKLVEELNSRGSEETLSRQTVETMIEELILDLQGETEVSEESTLLYSFPRIHQELTEVPEIRERQKTDRNLGNITLDSE